MSLGTENGTVAAHGRTWPLYERPVTQATVIISINADEDNPLAQPDALRAALKGDLQLLIKGGHEVDIKVEPVLRFVMSPEDRAEKLRLDEESLLPV